MTVRFLPPAEAELAEAIAYYDSQRQGLGAEFARAVQTAIERIAKFPHAWTAVSHNARSCLTDRFPYHVVYQLSGVTIYVVAVVHAHRRPRSWQERRREEGEE